MNEQFSQNNLEKFDEKALDAFITDMNQYDKDHNAGTWLGRGMAGIFMKEMDEETKGTEDETKMDPGLEKLQKKIQENLTIDDLENRHNPTLNKLGLNLESPNKEGNIDENETYAIGSIKMNLEDKTKYLLFLKSLDKEKITETQKKILEMTVQKLIDQVQNEYKLEEADERLLELFSGMRAIVSEYERLGMGEKVNDFKDYLEHANSGYLREYILAKNKGMFRPVGDGFALSTYQRDASYDRYLGYWDEKLFETLNEVKKNENAKEFYNSILKYAKDCIAFAENDPKLAEYEAKDHKEYVDGVRKAISEVKEKLSKIPEL
ncbi:MAG: hypothetical protein KBD10_02520 [Candidatus Pacebacteria bacterium]|nr:hypothetical protein [Candidatus Paceibacterota bacterium]